MTAKEHWEKVYSTKAPTEVSWYQATPARSLELIQETGIPLGSRILDVGGGDSTLVDHLLERGYRNLTVLDLSGQALNRAKDRLGSRAAGVRWLEGDATTIQLEPGSVDLWHDRAVFHFLTEPDLRAAYLDQVRRVVRPGGHVIIATFADDGPTRCSGLPVERYSAETLHDAFGNEFELLRSERETHHTPSGTEQRFVYCWFRFRPAESDRLQGHGALLRTP